jgi:hypothetical protein
METSTAVWFNPSGMRTLSPPAIIFAMRFSPSTSIVPPPFFTVIVIPADDF